MANNGNSYIGKAFKTPLGYKIPSLHQLKEDTQHPELNSNDFIQILSNYEEPKKFLPTFSHLDYSDGIFIVGTNHFASSVFDGNVIATEDFDAIVKHDMMKASFLISEKSTVTGLKFIDKNLVRNFKRPSKGLLPEGLLTLMS